MDSLPDSLPRRRLSLLDATSIIVGIIIGSSIYKLAPAIAANVTSPAMLIAAWVAGGVFALSGALCYAELSAALPRDGGEYVYLGRAYGPRMAFLYAWAVVWVIRPGTIGSLAFVFAGYAQQLWPLGSAGAPLYAAALVLLLTAVNLLGIRPGAWTQVVLTAAKTLGLLAIVAAAFSQPAATPAAVVAAVTDKPPDFRLAMIFILYAFGGWSDMPMVAAEVRHPERNLLRSLVLGTLAVTVIYLLVNWACLHRLGFAGLRGSSAMAVDLVRPAWGETGKRLVAALVCITAAGGVNGMIFTGARVAYVLGHDDVRFAPLGRWHNQSGGPLVALIAQAAIAVALILAFGRGSDGFERMLNYTSPVFYLFFLLTGLALGILRRREPDLPRPYRTTGYPVTWIVFCLSSAFMLFSSVSYAWDLLQRGETSEALWAGGVMLIGTALCLRLRGR